MPLSYETSAVPGFYSLTKRGIYRPKNVQTLTKCPELANMDNVQCFLGFPNFYRWFIKYYSIICKPLLNLIKRGDNFLFNNQTWARFETVSTVFTTAGIVHHFDPLRSITVETDGSNQVMAVMHWQSNGTWIRQLTEFYSRKMLLEYLEQDTDKGENLCNRRYWNVIG